LSRASPGILLNEHFEHDGPTVFAHACKLGLEGIVSNGRTRPIAPAGRPTWLKSKNPASPAAKREAEEDWGRRR
jgi:bifunctional non-homologous end joining protein LigD